MDIVGLPMESEGQETFSGECIPPEKAFHQGPNGQKIARTVQPPKPTVEGIALEFTPQADKLRVIQQTQRKQGVDF